MKFTVATILCLSVLFVHFNLSLATKKGKGGILSVLKKPFKSKTDVNTKSKDTGMKKEKGGYSQQPAGGYPQYPGHPVGYPQQPAGRYPQYPGHPVGYPQQPAGGQYPGHPVGYPQQPGGYPQYPSRPGGYPSYGSYPQYPSFPAGGYPSYAGGYGNYPGSYINHNPNNKILSPHYGGSYGYGGYGGGGGSPFSHSVQQMGYAPSSKSKGFGRSAAMAAAGGAIAGMALGYGMGRFPHPHFHFHSPQEEYYYNYYMYRRYGMKSTDKNDYSRDYKYGELPENFDRFMESCMRRTDLLPEENRNTNKQELTKTKATTTASVIATTTSNNTINNTKAGDLTTISPSQPLNKPEINASTPNEDDTVSIVEIGYPALIKQMKVRRCIELFIVYSERYLKKKTQPTASSGVQGLQMSFHGLLSVLSTTTLMLLNKNVLMLHN
ncbi:shadow of prion protein 2 [Nothobranchius furzeri]|uniref:shadow of prion protein 2 n=1 Tax=Nothobranchius furzeri TaxID=105023 RepID=UPI0039049A5D